MGTFTASLRAIGDVKALQATVELSDGRLRIAAGEMEIGSWPLNEIHLEEIPTGYRMAAEGEQILIELKNVAAFAQELEEGKKRPRPRLGRKKQDLPKPQLDPTPPEPARTPVTAAEPASPQPAASRPSDVAATHSITLPPREAKAKQTGLAAKGLRFVDGTLSKANKRLGPYLPDWVFTRAMFAIAFGALILMIALPGLVSTFLLITGAVMVVFGAVVYSDAMLASRWLPGRTTPQHALLFGLAILMMGVLLGIIAN